MELSTEVPRYILLQPWYAPGDQFIAEGTEVEYPGTPNEQMEPVNKAAKERMIKYLGTLQGGRTPRIEDVMYENILKRPKEGQVTLPHAVKDVPQMGNMKPGGDPSIKIVAGPPAEPRVKKLMGTVVKEGSSLGDTSL